VNKRVEEGLIFMISRLGLLDRYETVVMFSTIATRRMYEDWE
jgi:hypothetical protein